jgi:hypothetical protein
MFDEHTLDGTKTYGTFLSSQSSGRCSRISSGSASAASTTNSERPRMTVTVEWFREGIRTWHVISNKHDELRDAARDRSFRVDREGIRTWPHSHL